MRLASLTVALLRDWTRNREAVFFALFFPLILLVVFSLAFAGGPTEFEVAVQNNDVTETGEPTGLSAALVEAIDGAEPLAVERVDPDRNLDTDGEVTSRYQRVIVIPEGFDDRVRAESGRVRVAVIRDTLDRFGNDIPESQRATIEQRLQAIESQGGASGEAVPVTLLTMPDDQAAGAVGSILDSIVATFSDRSVGIDEPTATVTTEERGEKGLGAPDYYLPAFIVAMILINGVMTVPAVVATFKADGTLKRLAATPLRKREWIVANAIQQSILAVAIALVMVAVARLGFGVTAVPGPLAIALIVLGAVAFSSLGMTLAALIRSTESATSLGGAIALPLMFVSGIFWELDLMPETLRTIAELSPVTHYHRSLRNLMILDSTSGVPGTTVMLVVLAAVFLLAAVSLTRWREFD